MKEGYPERVCDYCHLQLNTFHAFVRKAKTTSTQFENMLQKLKQNDENNEPEAETDDRVTDSGLLSTNDMEFELSHEDDNYESDQKATIKMEFIVDKSKVQIMGDGDGDMDIPANEIEGFHHIHLLTSTLDLL